MRNRGPTEGALALQLMQSLIETMISRQKLKRTDLEHMIAHLNMEANRRSEESARTICEKSAGIALSWLLEAGDTPPKGRRPKLTLVKSNMDEERSR